MRLRWVDYAKGIGIILVVYGHVLRGINDANLGLGRGLFQFSDTLLYSFHMPLFFLLSGLFAERWVQRYSFVKGIREKVRSLLVPYLIWSAVQGGFSIVLSSYTNQEDAATIGSIAIDILISPFGQFWFVYYLFIFFLLLGAARKRLPLIFVFGIALVLYIADCLFAFPDQMDAIFGNLVYFCGGALLPRILGSARAESFMSKPIVFTALLAAFGIAGSVYAGIWDFFVLKGLSAILGIGAVLALSFKWSGQNQARWLERLGRLSMPIYLMHILAASGVRVILNQALHVNSVWIHLAIGVAAGIWLPVLVYNIMERLSVSSLLYGIKSMRSAPPAARGGEHA